MSYEKALQYYHRIKEKRRLLRKEGRNSEHLYATFPLESIYHNTLSNLPAEILHIIAEYLPVSSRAILSLCSKEIRLRLGPKYHEANIQKTLESCTRPDSPIQNFTKMYWTYQQMYWSCYGPPKLPEFKMFLFLLARDSPNSIFCFRCGRLHSPRRSDKVQNWLPWSWSNCESFDGSLMQMYYGPHFHFEGSQLAMQQHRCGLIPTKQLKHITKFSSLKKSFLPRSVSPDLKTLRSLEARIVSNRLLVKTIRKKYFRPGVSQSFVDTTAVRLYICPHLVEHQGSIRNITNCCLIQKGPYTKESESDGHLISQCTHCLTELQVEVSGAKGKFVDTRSLIVTVWQDFGSLDHPADPDWYSHLDTINSPAVVAFNIGSIRKAFENASSLK